MKTFLAILTSVLTLIFLYFAYVAFEVFTYVPPMDTTYRCGMGDLAGAFGLLADLILLPILIWLWVISIRRFKK